MSETLLTISFGELCKSERIVIDLMQQKESLEKENKCYQEQLKRFIE